MQVYAWTEFPLSIFGNLSAKTQPNLQKEIPTMHADLDLNNVDHCPSNAKPSSSSAMLYVLEDNEAVIKKADVPQ